jgi:type II secretory pathway predicted ATPase ExeA
MYESYYGLSEKPFSLTPDPKYLYRSESHANAFELLRYAVGRREGFVAITGDIGTGKTTLCRALLEQIDRTTFTALVLNPFLSEEDLLKRILQDFGVISREDIKAGRVARASKQDLIDALYDFLLGLIPINASAVLIIDEAQNLPRQVLEQIRILSNLETDKEKLLQIILVGQLNLQGLLRSPDLRQLDQRVSIRYELKPLDRDAVAAYVAHRLTIAGGSAAVTFTARALDAVHRLSAGIPRLINLICDRALLSGYSLRTDRITPDIVQHASDSLDLAQPILPRRRWFARPAPMLGAAAAIAGAAVAAVLAGYLYQRVASRTVEARAASAEPVLTSHSIAPAALIESPPPRLPDLAAYTVAVGSFPADEVEQGGPSVRRMRALTRWLEDAGYSVYYAEVDLGIRGRWRRVLAGAYGDYDAARAHEMQLRAEGADAHVVSAAAATMVRLARDADARYGTEP